MTKIPFYTISGFLGSGKTTLLQKIIDAPVTPYQRIVVVENDFAPIGIDAAMLPPKDNYRVLEINNGSVFCVCLLGSFVSSLSAFIQKESPDCVILEASGLSWPMSITKLMEKGDLATKIYPAAEICIVDARTFALRKKMFKQVEQGVCYADVVILNKCDLCTQAEIADVTEEVAKLNPFCAVYQTSCCDVDIEAVLLGGHRIPEASKTAALGSLSAPHHIETKVLSSSNRLPKEQMERFLSVADTCIRAKGFFNCSDGERYMLQCASGVTQAIPVVQQSALSQMVFIGCDVNWTQLSSFFE